jgi:hypothetical protein
VTHFGKVVKPFNDAQYNTFQRNPGAVEFSSGELPTAGVGD